MVLFGNDLNLSWVKCGQGSWCKLETVDLSRDHFNDLAGVYVIWHGNPNAWTVRVGQGFIRDRLSIHRFDDEILRYRDWTLYVTWAQVSLQHKDGVEKYLAERLTPLVGDRFPDCYPVRVNLPWDG
jgi:hypothetical protein